MHQSYKDQFLEQFPVEYLKILEFMGKRSEKFFKIFLKQFMKKPLPNLEKRIGVRISWKKFLDTNLEVFIEESLV